MLLVESEDGISCLNRAREEVLSVPRNLRRELARIEGVSPHSLHLVNERGELLTEPKFSIPPPSDNFLPIRVP